MIACLAGINSPVELALAQVEPSPQRLRWLELTAETRLCPGFHNLSFTLANDTGNAGIASRGTASAVDFTPLLTHGGKYVLGYGVDWRAGELAAGEADVMQLRVALAPSFARGPDAEVRIALFAHAARSPKLGAVQVEPAAPIWIRILPGVDCPAVGADGTSEALRWR